MDYITLGRTGVRASVAGLGCGGRSRLGLGDNKSKAECVALVRQALDLGVNLVDTAESYGTEKIVGKAIAAVPREEVILSTKKAFPPVDRPHAARKIRKSVERSLRKLKTDYVDIYHIHGVGPDDYSYASTEIFPHLIKLRDEGKIRFLGITEAFTKDPNHLILQQALKDDYWDVVMVGFNLLNQSARDRVFSKAVANNVGTLVMYAVRKALSQPARLREVCAELVRQGLVDGDALNPEEPLDFLIGKEQTSTIVDAAYRYCRHEPGVHVVLSGTGRIDHLKDNIESLTQPPLPESDTTRLKEIFGKVDCITGN